MDTTYSSGATGLPGAGAGSPAGSSASMLDDVQQEEGQSLREELASMKGDLDALMARASTLSDRELSRARDQLLARFASMRHAAKGMAVDARQQLNRGVDVTSDYVRDKPFQSVAIAIAAGALLGAWMRRGD